MKKRLMLVTPELAAQWLLRNKNNRPFDLGKILEIISAIRLSSFRSQDTIKITNDGRLMDGQHRCAAILLSGFAIELKIEIGTPMILGISVVKDAGP